jgi:predicted membrane-bound spermidine synthase
MLICLQMRTSLSDLRHHSVAWDFVADQGLWVADTTCLEKMSPNGILVTQAGPFSVNQVSEICTPVAKTLAAVFDTVHTYGAHIPSFGHAWGYHVACKQASTLDTTSPEDVE